MKRTAWCLTAVAVASLVGSTTQAQPAEAAAKEIGAYLDRLEKLGFAGSVVISKAGRPILAAGYGLAARERGIPWGPGTVSTVGSITKQFTGAAILALVESGALSVEDPISKYFAAVPEDKREITLYQLLTHSSGIVDLEGLDDWDPIDREEFVRRAMEQELAFEPGSAYEYSNAGFSLLGAIIEQLTQKSWEEYVRDRLFLPAGMYETGYILPQWGEGQLAQGYRGGERWGTVLERPLAEDGPYWVLRANGGVYSNAWDMVRWGQALLKGGPLSEKSMETYWSPHFDEGGGDSFYGYGWVVTDMAGHKVITHNGGNGILFADMAIVPDAELVMVIQTNVVADFRLAGRLLEQIGSRLLFGETLPSVPNRAATAPADLDRLAGVYDLEGGGLLRVTVDGDELAVEAEDREGFAALLSTRAVDAGRGRRLTERIDGIVSAYLAGDWSPLWEAYGRRTPLEQLASRGRSRLSAAVERHGSLRGHEVLGTAFRDGRDVTLVRIDFENGEVYRAYVWDPDEEEKLLGVSVRGLDHILHVLPEEGDSFASWDGRTGESRPVRFETVAGGGMRLRIGDLEAIRRK
jgi:CubicO group peptidase (beta-lactamase class C family)